MLEKIKCFSKKREDTSPPTTIEQYNHELDAAMDRINKGDFFTPEELEKEMQSW